MIPPPGRVSRIELLVENKRTAAFECTESDSSTVEAVKFHLTAVSGPVKTACGARATHVAPSSAEGFRLVVDAQCPLVNSILSFCVKNRPPDSLLFMTDTVCAQVASKENTENNNHLFLDRTVLVD